MEERLLSNKRGRLRTKSKEEIQEAVDIVMNSEDDEAAMEFLMDTLGDDFPELDLGAMDLHEAIGVLGGDEVDKEDKSQSGDREAVENLNKTLGEFMDRKSKTKSKPKGKKKVKKRRKKKKK